MILRKPRVKIDETNAATLQFLDLLKEVVDIAEIDGGELTSHLLDYMKKKKIGFESMKQYFSMAYLHKNREEFSNAINLACVVPK